MTTRSRITEGSVVVRPRDAANVDVAQSAEEVRVMKMWLERGTVPVDYLSTATDGAMILSAATDNAPRALFVANRSRAR